MHNEVAFPLHAERGAAYLTAPNIAACHAFSTRLGGVSTGVLESLNLSVRRGDTPENVRENWRRLGAAAGLDLTRAVYARQIHSADGRIAPPTRSRRSWSPALPATALSRTNRASRSRSLWPTACLCCCTTPSPGSSARCTAAGAARWPISSALPSRRCAPSARTRRTSAPPSAPLLRGRARGRLCGRGAAACAARRARAPARGRQGPARSQGRQRPETCAARRPGGADRRVGRLHHVPAGRVLVAPRDGRPPRRAGRRHHPVTQGGTP